MNVCWPCRISWRLSKESNRSLSDVEKLHRRTTKLLGTLSRSIFQALSAEEMTAQDAAEYGII